MSNIKLTIGMAHFADHSGVWSTIQALRLYQDIRDCEILVIDNDSEGEHGKEVASLVRQCQGVDCPVRYVPFVGSTGTTQTRERIFQEARGEAVLVMDCHVLLQPRAIERLKAFYAAEERIDLYTGPLFMDNLGSLQTHFEPVWRDQMWGTWANAWEADGKRWVAGEHPETKMVILKEINTDNWEFGLDIPFKGHERELLKLGYKLAGWDDNAEPFEIPAQGLGLFSATKKSWLGFNPHFKLFGGEECYIHEKYRQAGRKAICLPFMKWNHRFGRPGGPKYPITVEGKLRNYILGLTELGLDLEPCRKHFVDEMNVPQQVFDKILADPVNYQPYVPRPQNEQVIVQPVLKSNFGMALPNTDNIFEASNFIMGISRDLNEHAEILSKLASKSQHVTEMTERRESTIFLLAGLASKAKPCKGKCNQDACENPNCGPAVLVSYQEENDTLIGMCEDFVAANPGYPVTHKLTVGRIETLPDLTEETDTLFLDTRHTYDRVLGELTKYAPMTRKYIVIHDVVSHGTIGQDGGKGIGEAIQAFLKANPDWYIHDFRANQYGLIVLSKLADEKPATPIMPFPVLEGPGQELFLMLKDLGVEDRPGCDCKATALAMNKLGSVGCKVPETRKAFVEKIKANAEKWGWAGHLSTALSNLLNPAAWKLAWRLDPLDIHASLYDEAVRRAELKGL